MFDPVWLAAFCMVLCMVTAARLRNTPLFAQMDDDDIKIAGSNLLQEDSADAAARQFLKQKELGNIKKARALGQIFARELINDNRELFGMGVAEVEPVCVHHQILLYTYAIHRVSAEHSPDSMIAQTILNVFYNELENVSPEIYQHVCDMAAFSLYILCERSEKHRNKIGGVYARLCAEPDNAARIKEGNRLYQLYYEYCLSKCNAAQYSDTDGA